MGTWLSPVETAPVDRVSNRGASGSRTVRGIPRKSLALAGSHHLLGWVNPLGDRTSFTYASGTGSVSADEQPLGQQTKYSAPSLAIIATRAFGDPRGGRTTIMYGSLGAGGNYTSTDPFGNGTTYKWDGTFSQQVSAIKDARGVLTTFTYQLLGNGAYSVTGVRKAGYNSSTGQGQYSFLYNSNNQVKALVDELGNRSTLGLGQPWKPDRRGRSVRETHDLYL